MNLLQEIVYYLTILPRKRSLQKLLPNAKIFPNGSRYVCNPPVMTTDIDFLVLVDENIGAKLIIGGYKKSDFDGTQYIRSEYPSEYDISCYRKGVVNLIVTHSASFAKKHCIATHIVKRFNVRDKLLRVSVYEALRGNWDDIATDGGYRSQLPMEVITLLDAFNGSNGRSMREAYMAKYGIDV